MAEDCYAISGYAFIHHSGPVSWLAKQQEITSLFTTESEYVTATYTAKEALWLCSPISQLFDTNLKLTTLFSDNQSAIALTKDHQYHACTMRALNLSLRALLISSYEFLHILLGLDYVICHMVSRLTNLVMSWSQG